MAYETGAPKAGYRLAGWAEGANGLIWFSDEQAALNWLMDKSKPWQPHPGRKVFGMALDQVSEMKIIWPEPPRLEGSG